MKILIVVDMQNDFVTGVLGTKEAVDIVPKVDTSQQRSGARFPPSIRLTASM